MSVKIPLVGITCRSGEELPQHPDLYKKAVERAGALSIFIPPSGDAKDIARRCAGFIIPGGRDPAPALYNEKKNFDIDIDIEDDRRTGFELKLLHEIIRLRKPVLGICYGMQIINICFGGSLYQDIRAQTPKGLMHEREMHPVIIKENPYIESGNYEVNSHHHQAVKDSGEGIIPFAFSPDGVIEAVYLERYDFLLGVQWHPERVQSPPNEALFQRLAGACRAQQ